MADELDRKMLEMLSAGATLKAIAEETGQKDTNVKARRDYYIKEGAFDKQNKTVDWERFEVVEPQKRRGTGGDTTFTPSTPKPAAPDRASIPAEPAPRVAATFTDEEIKVLKAIVEERKQAVESKRSNKPHEPRSIRPDAGLWVALLAWAEEHNVKTGEAVNRAIEALLRVG